MSGRRKIVVIDETKCDGCGLCVKSCAEGAIQIVDGRARLVSETYCDGLGNCLGTCPRDAIRIEEREAESFDEHATRIHVDTLHGVGRAPGAGRSPDAERGHVCPGSMARFMRRPAGATESAGPADAVPSELTNWPVQLKLVSPRAPYFKDADLLLVADCVPFALADFHARFLAGKPVVIGCPKLDDAAFYVEKLTELFAGSSIKSLTVVHMEVPCCTGLVRIARTAMAAGGKDVPFRDVTISIGGEVLSEVGAEPKSAE